MPLYMALPHQYGAAVKIHNGLDFTRAYGIQCDGADRFTIIPPSQSTLKEWVRSCLCLGPYQGHHSCGGWSPFRSAVVSVHYGPIEQEGEKTETYYHKLGDNGVYDFASRTNPKHFILEPWLETLRSFVLVALLEYANNGKQEDVISPGCVVKKMLYVEWGSAGHEFTLLLCKACLSPDQIFEQIVDEAWRKIVRLPVPIAFAFATQDRVAQEYVIAFAGSVKKGLRV